jgi:hypothetical protein
MTAGPVRGEFKEIGPAGPDGQAPGRIGFMSTERREGLRPVRFMACIGASGFEFPVPSASRRETLSQGQTARPEENSGSVGHNSFKLDRRTLELVRLKVFRFLYGSRPIPGGRPEQPATRALLRLSFSPTPSPSVAAQFHHTLPLAPTAPGCRPERHDGKGNLYLQHSA